MLAEAQQTLVNKEQSLHLALGNSGIPVRNKVDEELRGNLAITASSLTFKPKTGLTGLLKDGTKRPEPNQD